MPNVPPMDLKRVSPLEAQQLVDDEGYILLDVRSVPEFEAGRAAGAYNIPLLHKDGEAMVSNSDFEQVVQASFPDLTKSIVTYCGMGGRSMRAARTLQRLGYQDVVDVRGGFSGEKGDAGSVINEGWVDSDLPTESGAESQFAYAKLLEKASPAESQEQDPPAPTEPATTEGLNRFASQQRKVMCSRLKRELPGLKRRPYPGELGERLFAEISALAWNEWVEHSKILINEYRIVTTDPKSMTMLYEECDRFFFGEGGQVPDAYVPPPSEG